MHLPKKFGLLQSIKNKNGMCLNLVWGKNKKLGQQTERSWGDNGEQQNHSRLFEPRSFVFLEAQSTNVKQQEQGARSQKVEDDVAQLKVFVVVGIKHEVLVQFIGYHDGQGIDERGSNTARKKKEQ